MYNKLPISKRDLLYGRYAIGLKGLVFRDPNATQHLILHLQPNFIPLATTITPKPMIILVAPQTIAPV